VADGRRVDNDKRIAPERGYFLWKIIFTKRNGYEIYQLCQRIAVMKDGELLDIFQKEDMYDNSRHAYTKELISIF
jgi:ABC-type dipeptide/oligopeptide/nickel transport system ATPase subunit